MNRKYHGIFQQRPEPVIFPFTSKAGRDKRWEEIPENERIEKLMKRISITAHNVTKNRDIWETFPEMCIILDRESWMEDKLQPIRNEIAEIKSLTMAGDLHNVVKSINQKITEWDMHMKHENESISNDRKLFINLVKKVDVILKRSPRRVPVSKETRLRILQRDNYTCKLCGHRDPTDRGLNIDHIIEVEDNGSTDDNNLQALCFRCNLMKSIKKRRERNTKLVTEVKSEIGEPESE